MSAPSAEQFTPIPVGAMARVITDPSINAEFDRHPAGTQFIVEDYVPAEDAEGGPAFYWGSNNGGMNNVCVPAAACEQALTVEQVANRVIPGNRAILEALMIGAMGPAAGFSLTAADSDAQANTINFEGVTSQGLRFGFTVQLTDLGEVS